MAVEFKWHVNERPPKIEPHSKAKLSVLRGYLRAYFDRLGGTVHQRDQFKLDLIDGFCGGGVYQDGDGLLEGSPLVMLEESRDAKQRLAQGRTKPLAFDFKHYFVDREQAHADYLNKELVNRSYLPSDDVSTHVGEFEQLAPGIIESIKRRQPRAGRSIFLLDQCGYSDVSLPLIRRILSELPAAEVIVTIAADALFNFMNTTPRFLRSVAPLSLGEAQIRAWLEEQNDSGRAVVQRAFRLHMRDVTGAGFDTPFFIKPADSRRALWFVHLSRHPTARDVMIQRHWAERSTFEHYGPAGLRMMGWDALNDEPDLFHFAGDDQARLHAALHESLPLEIHALASETPVSVETVRCMFANETAARFHDLDQVVIDLFRGKEVDILDARGRRRGSGLQRLRHDDRIALPHQLSLWTPGSERRFGAMKDQIAVGDDILDPLPKEELARWEGKPE